MAVAPGQVWSPASVDVARVEEASLIGFLGYPYIKAQQESLRPIFIIAQHFVQADPSINIAVTKFSGAVSAVLLSDSKRKTLEHQIGGKHRKPRLFVKHSLSVSIFSLSLCNPQTAKLQKIKSRKLFVIRSPSIFVL